VKVGRWLPWIYALPMMVFVVGIFAYPIATLFRYSLQNVATSAFMPSTFAGLNNFRYIFTDSLFATALTNNLKLFLCVPIMVALSVILSAVLFDRPRGWKIYRTLLFVPYVLSIPVVGVVFGYVFQYQGVFNTILRGLGLDLLAKDWIGSPRWALPTIMFVIIWKELGFGVVLCLARLMSVNESYFEAARVDGAGVVRQYLQIMLPLCKPALAALATLEFTFIYNDFLWALILIQNGSKRPITAALNNLQGEFFTDNNLLAAGALMSAIPALLVFVVLQKHFVNGLTLGANKG